MPEASLNVGVVGCGYWGRNLVRTFAELGALGAVIDPDAAVAESLAIAHAVDARSFEDVCDDPEITALVIAAPAKDHARLALRAIEAGKHVYVEKPLALDLADAEALVAAAGDAGRVLMVGHLLHYHPAFMMLQRMVSRGDLGQLRYLYSNRLNLGRFRREENILWSFAPHDISMILGLVGEEPDRVSAIGATFLSQNVPDVTTTHLSFPSGPRSHVYVSWLHPFKEQRLVVVGSEAMAVFDDVQPWDSKLTVFEHSVRWEDGAPSPVRGDGVSIQLDAAEPLKLECQHFLDSVRSGEPPRTDGHEGLRVLRVLDAAQASLRDSSLGQPLNAVEHARGGMPSPVIPAESPASLGDVFVHESSYVDDGVAIGAGSKVWHFSHILSGSTIGQDCTIGQNVVVGPDVTVGDRCRIQNNVSLYDGVLLEDGVFCGPSCVFTNVYNPRAEVSRKDEFRRTVVRRGATIGANATVVCGYEIGAYAFIGAGSVVTADVKPHALVVGNPARQIGWVSHEGERLGDDLVCPRTGTSYVEVDGFLQLSPNETNE